MNAPDMMIAANAARLQGFSHTANAMESILSDGLPLGGSRSERIVELEKLIADKLPTCGPMLWRVGGTVIR